MSDDFTRALLDPNAPIPAGWPGGAWGVFLLFLVPVGGGIPAGVLLARARGLSVLVMMARLRVFRHEITANQRESSLAMLLADLAGGVLAAATPAFSETLLEAERLSALYSEKLGTRSLDVLHVAGALVLGTRELLSFDARQAALARAAGLKAPAL